MFPITHPPSSDIISIPLLYPVSDTSLVPPTTPPQPLQVYTHHPRTDTRPLADSYPMAPPSTMPVLSSLADLPIVIRKGNLSSRNPHPIYNFLTYHRYLSHTLHLFPPCPIFMFHKLCMRLYPIRTRNKLWSRKWLLYILVALEI